MSSSSSSTDDPNIFEEYFQYTREGVEKYGQKTVVWMKVGVFYEMYGVRDKKTREVDAAMSPIIEVAQLCNQLAVTDKKLTLNGQPLVMAGFRDYSLDKYAEKTIEGGYTILKYEQFANTEGGKKMRRELAEILSIGTYLAADSVELSNHTVCIWIDVFTPRKRANSLQLQQQSTMVCGLSVVNIVSGASALFEYSCPLEWTPNPFDELERFISIYKPSEVIFVSTSPELEE